MNELIKPPYMIIMIYICIFGAAVPIRLPVVTEGAPGQDPLIKGIPKDIPYNVWQTDHFELQGPLGITYVNIHDLQLCINNDMQKYKSDAKCVNMLTCCLYKDCCGPRQ